MVKPGDGLEGGVLPVLGGWRVWPMLALVVLGVGEGGDVMVVCANRREMEWKGEWLDAAAAER
jgi:hypothetical protein